MNESSRKGIETRRRNQALREQRKAAEMAEAKEQIAALKLIRDDPNSTVAERMEAIKMIAEYISL